MTCLDYSFNKLWCQKEKRKKIEDKEIDTEMESISPQSKDYPTSLAITNCDCIWLRVKPDQNPCSQPFLSFSVYHLFIPYDQASLKIPKIESIFFSNRFSAKLSEVSQTEIFAFVLMDFKQSPSLSPRCRCALSDTAHSSFSYYWRPLWAAPPCPLSMVVPRDLRAHRPLATAGPCRSCSPLFDAARASCAAAARTKEARKSTSSCLRSLVEAHDTLLRRRASAALFVDWPIVGSADWEEFLTTVDPIEVLRWRAECLECLATVGADREFPFSFGRFGWSGIVRDREFPFSSGLFGWSGLVLDREFKFSSGRFGWSGIVWDREFPFSFGRFGWSGIGKKG